MIRKTLYFSVSIIGSFLVIEYLFEKYTRKQLKSQIRDLLNNKNDSDINCNTVLKNEFSKVKSCEKIHILYSFENTFNINSNNLEKFIPRINSYKILRQSLDSNKIFETANMHMIWYPYSLRLFFNFCNDLFLFSYKFNYSVKEYNNNNNYIYTINDKHNNKNVVLFLGLGGILFPFNRVINFFLEKGYNIIIPLYGPAQASLKFNLNINENSYYQNIRYFLLSKKIYNFDIISWSLGGILYKGFHNYIIKYNDLKINHSYLFEPLICVRSCMDTFFSHIREYKNTLNIMNFATSKKYNTHNIIFSYFLHTIIGFGTAQSLGYFTNVETKNKENIEYKRFLFVSSDDLIINYKLDKEYIKNNYCDEYTYYRKGYHGGWPNSNKLLPILEKIVK